MDGLCEGYVVENFCAFLLLCYFLRHFVKAPRSIICARAKPCLCKNSNRSSLMFAIVACIICISCINLISSDYHNDSTFEVVTLAFIGQPLKKF